MSCLLLAGKSSKRGLTFLVASGHSAKPRNLAATKRVTKTLRMAPSNPSTKATQRYKRRGSFLREWTSLVQRRNQLRARLASLSSLADLRRPVRARRNPQQLLERYLLHPPQWQHHIRERPLSHLRSTSSISSEMTKRTSRPSHDASAAVRARKAVTVNGLAKDARMLVSALISASARTRGTVARADMDDIWVFRSRRMRSASLSFLLPLLGPLLQSPTTRLLVRSERGSRCYRVQPLSCFSIKATLGTIDLLALQFVCYPSTIGKNDRNKSPKDGTLYNTFVACAQSTKSWRLRVHLPVSFPNVSCRLIFAWERRSAHNTWLSTLLLVTVATTHDMLSALLLSFYSSLRYDGHLPQIWWLEGGGVNWWWIGLL